MRVFLEIVFTIFLVSSLCFFIIRLVPGDAVSIMASNNSTEEDLDKLRASLRLDKNIFVQYKDWLISIVHLDFGKSFYSNESALSKVSQRLPATLKLTLLPFVLSVFLSILLALLCLIKPWGLLDNLVLLFISVFSSTTAYIVNLILSVIFSLYLRVFPLYNNITVPIIGLTLVTMPNLLKFLRASLITEKNKDYYTFFYMIGLPKWRLFLVHLLPNSMITFIPIVSINFGAIIGFSIAADRGFGISGIASLLLESLLNKDYNVIQLCVFVLSVIYIVPYYLLRVDEKQIKN